MRKVKFKKWIPNEKVLSEGNSGYWITKVGTGKWEEDFTNDGLFHQWGSAYEEFESGAGNYTVALVEVGGGEIVEVLPSKIKFV